MQAQHGLRSAARGEGLFPLNLQYHLQRIGAPPLTLALIIISVLASFLFRVLHIDDVMRVLMISQYYPAPGTSGLIEVGHGQIWRLFTPMFIHFSLLHIVFNMLWLWELGGMVERQQRARTLMLLVLVFSAGSNLAQYWVSGPLFGGMSGVVYGLLGYCWIRGHFDPWSNLHVPKPIVIMMLIWLVLCFTGLVGQVANAAHVAGLVLGVVWGFLSAKVFK